MNKSESITALSAALAKAQGEMENADKKSVNPHFRSKYADLAEIINTVRPALAKYGLAVVQYPSFDGQLAHVETIITHESGEWLSGVTSSPVQKADPQGIGSATTYLRRYSLAAVCGIAQEDDDGNHATGKKPASTKSVTATVDVDANITAQQLSEIVSLYKGKTHPEILEIANAAFQKVSPGCKLVNTFQELTKKQAGWFLAQTKLAINGTDNGLLVQ